MEFESIFVALGCIAIAVIAYTVYLNSVDKPSPPASSVSESTAPTVAPTRLMFFFSTWCPWSKKARPQWDAFRDDLAVHPMTYGGKTVKLEEYDGDVNPNRIRDYGVTGYPTIVLTTPSGDTTLKCSPTKDSIRNLLIRTLGAEEPVKLPSSTT
jgi:thiol-disulfide isomerase/thioredoxin